MCQKTTPGRITNWLNKLLIFNYCFQEVAEPGPNFIVVYDLQNGTLFKKWKPGVDTTSLDISSKDSCVISGLSDARILVWDLVTGG